MRIDPIDQVVGLMLPLADAVQQCEMRIALCKTWSLRIVAVALDLLLVGVARLIGRRISLLAVEITAS